MLGDKREQGVPLLNHLAVNGWVGINANYRLSPRAKFPDHLIDLKKAIAWYREHAEEHGADPNFLCVTGGSAGGHLTALVGLTPNDPEYQEGFEDVDTTMRAAVPFYGVYDMTNRHGRWHKDTVKRFFGPLVIGKNFDDDPDAFRKASPMDLVRADAPPFFVIHGSLDTLVPVEDARHFVELLREASDSPVLYAEMQGAEHAFDVFRRSERPASSRASSASSTRSISSICTGRRAEPCLSTRSPRNSSTTEAITRTCSNPVLVLVAVDFDDTPEEAAFRRTEAREWLAANAIPKGSPDDFSAGHFSGHIDAAGTSSAAGGGRASCTTADGPASRGRRRSAAAGQVDRRSDLRRGAGQVGRVGRHLRGRPRHGRADAHAARVLRAADAVHRRCCEARSCGASCSASRTRVPISRR